MYQQRPNEFVEAAERAVRRRLAGHQNEVDAVFSEHHQQRRLDFIATLGAGVRKFDEARKLAKASVDETALHLWQMQTDGIVRSYGEDVTYVLLDESHPAYDELVVLARALAVERGYAFSDTSLESRVKGKKLKDVASRTYGELDPMLAEQILEELRKQPEFAERYRGFDLHALHSYVQREFIGHLSETYVYQVVPASGLCNDWTEYFEFCIEMREPANCCKTSPVNSDKVTYLKPRA